jgi:protease IV
VTAGARGIPRRLGANAARALRRGAGRLFLPRGRWWVRVRVPAPLPELVAPVLLGREPVLSLMDVVQVLRAASRDPRVAGVIVRLEGPLGGLAKAQALRRGLAEVRAAGRPALVWAERLGAFELLAASGATRVWLPESGSVFLVGLRLQGFFLRGLLDQLGVRADVVRAGDYKTAAEMLTRHGMSTEGREQLEVLAEDLFTTLVEEIAEGRGLAAGRVRELVDGGPYGARAACEAGLVDGCLYPDEIEKELLRLAPGVGLPEEMPFVDGTAYLARAADPGWRPFLRDLPRFAYVVASGAIHGGHGLRGVASDAFRTLFERLRRDEGVRGLLLRIESPGGDAVASDLLWRALRHVGSAKPVVASLGDVAASGGYFLAAGAHAILAESATMTGSIGVVGGKIDVSKLYERLGVRKESIEHGARAGLLAEERGFTPGERQAVRREMDGLYGLFLDRVATGRGLAREAVHAAGGGRVWSGRRARDHGLVDGLGGPLESLDELRRRAGLGPTDPLLLETHPRIPRLASLRGLLRAWLVGTI